MASMQKQLQKELLALQNDSPPGITLNKKSVQSPATQWIVDMEGAPGILCEGANFQLLFNFSSQYPLTLLGSSLLVKIFPFILMFIAMVISVYPF